MWTAEDREWALAWQAEQDLVCPGCGLPRDETMVNEEDAPFYEVVSLACHACKARDLAARDAAENNGGKSPPGRFYTVKERVV